MVNAQDKQQKEKSVRWHTAFRITWRNGNVVTTHISEVWVEAHPAYLDGFSYTLNGIAAISRIDTRKDATCIYGQVILGKSNAKLKKLKRDLH